uniref:FERM domain-containing protein n=1 Tax=Trichuris muris TaxID=70415 RepID=A0A5S6R1H8_TRIMR
MATMKKMCDGRRTQIVLLDDRRLDIAVQTRLSVTDLLNIVASHCCLKDPDRQYFGLAFYDDRQQLYWLNNERRVLDHEFPKQVSSNGALILYHRVRYFVDTFLRFSHASSVELLFLQVRSLLYSGIIHADHDTVFQLGALALQASCGDYRNERLARDEIKKLPLFSQDLLKYYYSISECEDHVIEVYKSFTGLSRGNAIVKYLTIVERLETYGLHFYEVKDKAGSPCLLGVSGKGILQFTLNDRANAVRTFGWSQLENLYYRDKKFSIEVHDHRRTPLSRRAFVPSSLHVLVYICDTPQLCKNLWSLAIAQHQFYLDTKTVVKKDKAVQLKLINTVLEGLNRLPLNQGELSNNSTSDLGSSVSSQSLRSLHNLCNADEELAKESEYYRQLQNKRQALELLLREKLKDLKNICVQEGNITGEIPTELYRALAPGEAEPKIRRRVGTSFSIASDLVNKLVTIDRIAHLEANVEVKRKIVAGHQKLASDPSVSSIVRRRRRQDLKQAIQQLQQLEQELHEMYIRAPKYRVASGPVCIEYSHSPFKGTRLQVSKICRQASGNVVRCSADAEYNERVVCYRSRDGSLPCSFSNVGSTLVTGTSGPAGPKSVSIPNSPNLNARAAGQGRTHSWRQPLGGYRPCISYQSTYRQQNFPTLINQAANEPYHRLPPLNASLSSSFHSLRSAESSSAIDERDVIAPLRPFAKASPDAGGHRIGSYNVPQQRTSWDHECLEQMNRPALGSTESVNSGLNNHSLPPPPNGTVAVKGFYGHPTFTNTRYMGSLDRRYLRFRGGEMATQCKRDSESNRLPVQTIKTLDRSPSRSASHFVPAGYSIETSKPYSTEDFLRYSTRTQSAMPYASRVSRTSSNGSSLTRSGNGVKPCGESYPTNAPRAQDNSPLQRNHCQKVMTTHDVQDVLSWYDPEGSNGSTSPLKAATVV